VDYWRHGGDTVKNGDESIENVAQVARCHGSPAMEAAQPAQVARTEPLNGATRATVTLETPQKGRKEVSRARAREESIGSQVARVTVAQNDDWPTLLLGPGHTIEDLADDLAGNPHVEPRVALQFVSRQAYRAARRRRPPPEPPDVPEPLQRIRSTPESEALFQSWCTMRPGPERDAVGAAYRVALLRVG
jgi:hypothetical protein